MLLNKHFSRGDTVGSVTHNVSIMLVHEGQKDDGQRSLSRLCALLKMTACHMVQGLRFWVETLTLNHKT